MGWIEQKIKNINERKSATINPAHFPDETFELFSVPIFPTGNAELLQGKEIGSTKQLVEAGDVLLCKINPRINRVWVVTEPKGFRQIASSEWIVISSSVHDSDFLKYYFRENKFRGLLCSDVSGVGGSLTRAKPKLVNEYNVIVAPLAEQTRIVEKLDEVLAQVDTIKARLDGIPAILKRFRQSVLAAAVSGKLTEEWRGGNAHRKPELASFAKYWEKEYSLSGRKYSQPNISHDKRANLCLPDNWLDTCIGNVFDVHVGATPSRKESIYWNGDIPWVSSGEVAFSFISDTAEKITESGLSNSSTKLHPKGTVMLAMIGQGKTRGQPAILRIEAAHNQNTAAMRVPEGMCISEFLYYYLWEKYEETRRVGSGNNQKALNKSAVQHLHFPCPPYEEQKEIVRLVDQYFAFADTIEALVKKAQARVDKLTQSILAKAFRGELVPQDPNDEPADKLLERIATARKEAEALAKAAKKAGRKKVTA